MTKHRQIATGIYGFAGIGSTAFGAMYLFRDQFMPYHEAAVGLSWAELSPEMRTLMLALLDVAGACWAVAGLLILAMVAGPFRRGALWARGAIPAAMVLLYVPVLNATIHVLTETPATPPWYGAAFALVVTATGLAFDRPWRDLDRGALRLPGRRAQGV